MDDYNFMNQDTWWRSETSKQNPQTNYSYEDEFYNNECDYGDPYESYDNNWQWTDNSGQNQYQESPFFSENQDSSDKYSSDNKLDQMLDMIEKSRQLQEISLSNIQKSVEYITEQLNQQPSDNTSDTTHENEVSFLSSDELYDTKMHKPTPPKLEVVVEDYVSLNNKKTEKRLENEEVEIGLENNQINLNEPIIPKVGEGLVEVNTISCSTTLSKTDEQPSTVIDFKRLYIYKKLNVFINRPFLTTIHAQVSSHKSVPDVIFENKKLKVILFSPTNDPPIVGDLLVINTIDDHVYEHTANTLSNITRKLENCLPCNRSRMLNDFGSPLVMKKTKKKKQDFTFIRRSKMKWRGCKKHQARKSCRKDYAWCFKTRFKCSCEIHNARRLGFYMVKEGVPFDPGGSQITYDSP